MMMMMSFGRRCMSAKKYYRAPEQPGNWRILGTAVVERKALQMNERLDDFEKQYVEWRTARRDKETELRGGAKKAPGLLELWLRKKRLQVADAMKQSTHDEEAVDKDIRSLLRLPRERLYLVLRRRGCEGDEHEWQFPSRIAHDDETIRRCAEIELETQFGRNPPLEVNKAADNAMAELRGVMLRATQEEIARDFRTFSIGNAPVAHQWFRSTEAYKQASGYDGTKVFYMRSYLCTGEPQLAADNERYVDYAWLRRSELADYLAPSVYDVIQHVAVDC
jgi:hypothetical protein